MGLCSGRLHNVALESNPSVTDKEFQSFRLALIPIGSYDPRWFMRYGHMNPEEAVQAHLDLNSEQSIGIHWGTFPLADTAYQAPAHALAQARIAKGISDQSFLALQPGQVWHSDPPRIP